MIFEQIIALAANQTDATFFGMDANVATVWVELGSAVFFALTVLFMIQSNRQQKRDSKEYHEQTKIWKEELEIDEYAELRQHHHDLITLQIDSDNEETLKIYDKVEIPDPYRKIENDDNIVLTIDEKRIFQFYLAEFDLYERVWKLKEEKEKVSEYEWLTWLIYFERMSHHWLFRYSFNQIRTIFDDGFMDHIKEKIIDRQDRGEDAREEILKDARFEYEKEYKKELIFSEKSQYP